MFKTNKFTQLFTLSLTATLVGCGGSDNGDPAGPTAVLNPPPLVCNGDWIPNEAGTACIEPPPPIACPAPQIPNDTNDACIDPMPGITAGDNEAVLYYYREDGDYSDWKLHAWNNDACDAYTDDFLANITWEAGAVHTGEDAAYGAYWVLPLKDGYGECANFIIHKGNEKDPNDNDQVLALTGDRWAFAISGIGLFDAPILAANVPAPISGMSGHFIDEDTIVWNVQADMVKLAHSATAAMQASDAIDMDSAVTLTATELSEAQKALVPHLADWYAYTHDADTAAVKSLMTSQLVIAAVDSDNKVTSASYVQAAKVLDDLYTKGDNDADEAKLGTIFNEDGTITTAAWAPTAQNMMLKLYNADKMLVDSYQMTLDMNTGIWSYTLDASADRHYYRYEVTVYHPATKQIETTEATDPYSVSVSTNGRYTQIVNLDDADLKPAGWDDRVSPTIESLESAVIYEGHVRDFSVMDMSVDADKRGKYLAFAQSESKGMMHLKSLAEAGVTHFHLLPLNDMGTVNEDMSARVELTDTVGDLCALNSSAPVCGVESDSAVLKDVMASYDASTDAAQALAQSMRGLDGFNWGYDPHHFNVPEGSYASNAEGAARILETRAMIKGLNDAGLRTALDVVYNHTTSSALFDNSVFDKLVPGYYHRYNEVNGNIERSTCCENTASEHKMMDKFVIDSLVLWADAYGFDSFRFDIMGQMPKQLLLDSRAAVQAIDPDTYFYGEGWNFGEVASDRLFEQATQNNLAGTEIGTFNDRPRDTTRDGALFQESVNLNNQDHIRLGLAGTLKNYVLQDNNGNAKPGSSFAQASYGEDPADIINYVSKHDGRTLWDQLQLGLPDGMTLANRVRAQNIAATIPLMSQGIPFFQLGGEMLRSKSMDRNSYDAGDWFNAVDYDMNSSNWNVGLPLAGDNQGDWERIGQLIANAETAPTASEIQFASAVFKEMLMIRKASPLFKLGTEAEVMARVGFHNTGSGQTPGLIVMSIDDGIGQPDLDSANDAIVVVINGTNNAQSQTINTASGFELHSVQMNSADATVRTAMFEQGTGNGTFTVPALTTAVFVKPQGESQGEGLKVNPNEVAPPYGDTPIYVRGLNGNWDPGYEMTYDGAGKYSYSMVLSAGDYEFKIASQDWSTVNLGWDNVDIAMDSVTITGNNTGDNMMFSLTEEANYTFTIDANNTERPTISITMANMLIDCAALPTMDGYPFSVAGDSGKLFVRGSHSEWGPDEQFALNYKGENRYQAVANFEGDFQFKLASDDGSWTTQLFAANDDGAINTAPLQLDNAYSITYGNSGTDNNQSSLPAGKYSFMLTLNEENPAEGNNVGTLMIQQCKAD